MRIRNLVLAISVGLLPAFAMAQTPPAAPPPAGPQTPAPTAEAHPALPTTFGFVDFGIRGTHVDGDSARYERYRDLSSGPFIDFSRYSTQKNGWQYDLAADHVGRKDQRYEGNATLPGQVKVWGEWDQIPMLMSRTTQTLFLPDTAPGDLEIADDIQKDVQANAANLSKYIPTARTFELSSRRHIFDTGVQYVAKSGLTLDSTFRKMNREGDIPFGGSFGHSNVVETLAPVHHDLTDFGAKAEYAKGNLLARGGYTGSWFTNNVTSLTFDNPWRFQDISSAGSQGRTALAPSNSLVGVNGMVSYKLPAKSRVTAYGSIGSLRDTDAPLLPHTINAALVSPPLSRTTTDGHAKTSSINLTFISRPVSAFDIDVRYRTYDYDNQTPEFLVTQRVGYDNSVSNVAEFVTLTVPDTVPPQSLTVPNPARVTEPFGVKRGTFDADVRFNAWRAFSAGAGYGHLSEERTHRIFEKTTDDTFRLVFDSVANPWVMLRSKYQYTQRRGEGDEKEIAVELLAIGEQPGIRHSDIASKNRNRVTITGIVPLNTVSFNVQYGAGKDDYLDSLFGLRDNNNQIASAGFDYAPSEYFGTGLSYSYEHYTSLSRSRQASSTTEALDPSRNWATDTADNAHSVIGHFEMLQIRQKVDVKVFGDYSHASGHYNYIAGAVPNRTLPEEAVVPSTLPPPTQLAPTKSELARANFDVSYALAERWGLTFSVWYERYRVEDFSLDAEAQSRLDPAGALLLGYQYLPYDATTVWGRVIYKF